MKLILLIIILLIIIKFLDYKTPQKNIYNKKNNKYSKKNLMTDFEYTFYLKIKELEDEMDIRIIPQINLAAIIKKDNKTKYQSELYRNIDFAIFKKDLKEILLLIELNDSTHYKKNRKKRDKNVKDICGKANIKLITFYSKYQNEKEYVKNRIKKELNEHNNYI